MKAGFVEPDDLMEQIAGGHPPVIVDVRSAKEFVDGHVPGAVHLPFWQAGRRWQMLAAARGSRIVVYCGHGPRAYIAGAVLRRHGFNDVVYLAGHMQKWRARHFPLEGR